MMLVVVPLSERDVLEKTSDEDVVDEEVGWVEFD